MDKWKVERLLINYKTLEEFEKFSEYGLAELSMFEDLRDNIIENDSISPFYGVYHNDQLIARISLYRIDAKYDPYFEPAQDYFECWKLEVLPQYRHQGIGSLLINHAKSLGLPIKTNARRRSDPFWRKMGFTPVRYDPQRDRGESPFVWLPRGVELRS